MYHNSNSGKSLKSYLNYGDFNFDPSKSKYSPPINYEETKKEVEEDLNSFFDYLKNSIFYGCGIESFYEQELNALRFKFKSEKSTWQTIVLYALKNGKIDKSKLNNRGVELPNISFDETKKFYDILNDLDNFIKK